MRKVTKAIKDAFVYCEDIKLGNSKVTRTNTTTIRLVLHGHVIASKTSGVLVITNCGYFTNVTKDRLNALPGVNIFQRKGVWYLNDVAWDGKPIVIGAQNAKL